MTAPNSNTRSLRPAPDVAWLLDPRFPGGTSSAVAQELRVVSRSVRPRVYGISSKMFSGTQPARQLRECLDDLGMELCWDPATVQADVVVLHNPAFLKFQDELRVRILCRKLVVVTHENFLRPGGAEGFDVSGCLRQIDRASLALHKVIAPVSAWNRKTVLDWLASHPEAGHWAVEQEDWFNICDFDMRPPNSSPRDRRGRLSRPGFEKFPPLDVLETCFPPHAESNLMLGADTLLDEAGPHPHWKILPFGAMPVEEFFEAIDFMVYFTAPTLRESFGRAIAEAIGAGKVVISDPATAENFAGAVLAARPEGVDGIIRGLVADPAAYCDLVRRAQRALGRFSGDAFQLFFERRILGKERQAA